MLFYLHCGRGFNCLYRGWMKNVSQVVLFVVICKTILVLTNCQVTLDTFEHHCSHHTFHWTHVTSLFHGIAARPVHIVTCFRSYDVSRSWGWSPYMHGWSRLTHSPCQHLSVRGESKICMRFSSHRMTIKGCNCSQWPGPRVGKRAFLSTSIFEDWPCSYWPSYLQCQHAPFYGCNAPQLPSLSHSCIHVDNCLLCVDHECLSGGTCLSCPSTPQLSSHPWPLLECHNVSISVSSVCGPWACPFYASSLYHNRKFFSWAKWSDRSG